MEYMEIVTDRSRKIKKVDCLNSIEYLDLEGIMLFPIVINELAENNWVLKLMVPKIENDGYLFYFERPAR